MNATANWYFPKLSGGQEKGLNSSEADLFQNPENLGKETAQNSINSAANGEKVLVEYRLTKLPIKFIPGLEDYKRRLEYAKTFFETEYGEETNGNESEILTEMIEELSSQEIEVLVISDYGTKGLYGSETEKKSPFCRFFKSSGISAQQGSNAGTYGYGRNALMGDSSARIVSVISRHRNQNIDKPKEGLLYAGWSTLCTHPDPETDVKTQQTGFFGFTDSSLENGWLPIRDQQIEESFVPPERKEYGTDIYIWGYKQKTRGTWEIELTKGLIHSFFQAVKEKKIEFKIFHGNEQDPKYHLNEKSIRVIHNSLKEIELKKTRKAWREHKISSVHGFLKCSENPTEGEELKVFKDNIDGIGDIEISIYTNTHDDDLINHYCIMRESRMTIEDKAFKANGTKYSAICKMKSSEGNDFLAALEDPTHSILDIKYLRKPKKSTTWYSTKLTELRKAIKSRIRELDAEIQEYQEIPKLSEHLQLPSTDSIDRAWPSLTSEDKQEERSPNEPETYISKLLNKFISRQVASSNNSEITNSVTRKKVASTSGNTGGNPGVDNRKESSHSKKNRGSGDSDGKTKEDSDGKSTTYIPDQNIFMTRSEINPEKVKVTIRALKDIQGDLRIGISLDKYGEKMIPLPESAIISWENNKTINGSTIKNLDLKETETIELLIGIKNHSNFALGVY